MFFIRLTDFSDLFKEQNTVVMYLRQTTLLYSTEEQCPFCRCNAIACAVDHTTLYQLKSWYKMTATTYDNEDLTVGSYCGKHDGRHISEHIAICKQMIQAYKPYWQVCGGFFIREYRFRIFIYAATLGLKIYASEKIIIMNVNYPLICSKYGANIKMIFTEKLHLFTY